jgi:uncharacterized ion transporter superfamily protein YfcC
MTDHASPRRKALFDPILMMVAIIVATVAITYIVPSGKFDRHGGFVVADTFKQMPKISGLAALAAPDVKPTDHKPPVAQAASLVAAFASIPAGLALNVGLIINVLMVGAMFHVLRATGAVDAGVDRLIHIAAGNNALLVSVLMLLLGAGSSFFGFVAEYLVLIPMLGIVGERLGYGRMFALAVVGVAAKVGYMTSITNPFALVIAQPMAHVPLFSGMWYRIVIFAVFTIVGTGYVLYVIRPERAPAPATAAQSARLSLRHTGVLLCLLGGAVTMVVGFVHWKWGVENLSAFYVFLSVLFAITGRVDPLVAADAFVNGMKNMVLSALLIGLAGSVQYLLQNSFVLDTLVYHATSLLHGMPAIVCANGLMLIEMALGIIVPSTSGKVAMSMPILAPIAQLSGVTGQTTVLAFVLGNGLTNMISPTTGLLLAYVATAKVSFGEWFKFAAPLFAALLLLSAVALGIAVLIGY